MTDVTIFGRGKKRPTVTDEQYADEAAQVRQRHLDQVREIAELKSDNDVLRNRTAVAEAENDRLKTREQDLLGQLDRQRTERMQEVDALKEKLAILRTHFTTYGKIIIDSIRMIDGMGTLYLNTPSSLTAALIKVDDPIDLQQAADDLHKD